MGPSLGIEGLAVVLKHATKLIEEEEQDDEPPIFVMHTDLDLVGHLDSLDVRFLIAFAFGFKSESFFGDTFTGKEEFEGNADNEGGDKDDHDDEPASVGVGTAGVEGLFAKRGEGIVRFLGFKGIGINVNRRLGDGLANPLAKALGNAFEGGEKVHLGREEFQSIAEETTGHTGNTGSADLSGHREGSKKGTLRSVTG